MPRRLRSRPVAVEQPAYGVAVFESRHSAAFMPEELCNPYWKLLYVLAGAGTIQWSAGKLSCRAGDLILVGRDVRHMLRDRPGEPMSLYAVCVWPSLLKFDAAGLLQAGMVWVLTPDALFGQQVRSALRQMLFEVNQRRQGFEWMIAGKALELLAGIVRQKLGPTARASARQRVSALVVKIRQRFLDFGGIDSIANQLGLSRRRFTQVFREVTGSSWRQFVRRLQIEHAQILLRDSNQSVTSVGFRSGFEDLSTFYRAFARECGCTPQEWRGRIRLKSVAK